MTMVFPVQIEKWSTEGCFLPREEMCRDGAILLWMRKGAIYLSLDGASIPLMEGEAILLSEESCRAIMRSDSSSGCVCEWVRFRSGVAGDSLEAPDILPCTTSADFYRLFARLRRNSGADIATNYALSTLLIECIDENRRLDAGIGAKVVRYIEAQYRHNITFDELTHVFPYSRDHLARVIKKEIGLSMHEYIHILRMDDARRLLAETMQTVREIAFACGYPNERMFVTQFKKRNGLTPETYRKHLSRKTVNNG